jgi:hypothetical protein
MEVAWRVTIAVVEAYTTPESGVKPFLMSNTTHESARWTPETPEDRDLVTRELNAILSSSHFSGSKRYPALLKYVVSKTLDGHSDELKERTLGVEVFDRSPDYDTNADPVVRFSASEVRKRLAQYYSECDESSQLLIQLPLGSYVPEFKPKGAAPNVMVLRRSRSLWWVAAAFLLTLAVFGAYSYRKASAPRSTDKLWDPLLHSPASVLIVVGTSDFVPPNVKPVEADVTDHLRGPFHHITMSSAIALARMAGFLQANGKAYEIKDDREVSLTDFRSRPVILIGARNNPWTMRLTDPLRFRFDFGSLSRIQDRENPNSNAWNDPHTYESADSSTSDYALITRYHDSTTNGTVMVVAGLGTYGTEAASEFAVSPQYIDQLLSKAPADWEDKNLEIVIRTDKINGEAGPPYLVSSTSW